MFFLINLHFPRDCCTVNECLERQFYDNATWSGLYSGKILRARSSLPHLNENNPWEIRGINLDSELNPVDIQITCGFAIDLKGSRTGPRTIKVSKKIKKYFFLNSLFSSFINNFKQQSKLIWMKRQSLWYPRKQIQELPSGPFHFDFWDDIAHSVSSYFRENSCVFL